MEVEAGAPSATTPLPVSEPAAKENGMLAQKKNFGPLNLA
jgi:hypothetical protein